MRRGGLIFSDGDTVNICAHFCDLSRDCPPNCSDTCWSFSINLAGPVANFISPLPETYTSCDSGPVLIHLYDANGVVESSIRFTVAGENLTVSSPGVSYINDTLRYTPPARWSNGERVTMSVDSADDRIGNHIYSRISGRFYVDVVAPLVLPIYPFPGRFVPAGLTLIARLSDDLSGVDPLSVSVNVNGNNYSIRDYSAGLSLSPLNDTLYLDFDVAGIVSDDSIHVEIRVSDMAQFCGANESIFSYWFFTDKNPPEVSIVRPQNGEYTSCNHQEIEFLIEDDNGIRASSCTLSVNSELITIDDSRLTLTGSSLIFRPSVPFSDGINVSFCLNSCSDTLGNSIIRPVCASFITDFTPPSYISISPEIGDTLSDPFESVIFRVSDDGCGIDFSTLQIFYGSDTFGLSDITVSGDSIVISPLSLGIHFPERQYSSLGVSVSDCALYCGANVSTDSTEFYVLDDDSLPPVLIRAEPSIWSEDSSISYLFVLSDESGIFSTAFASDPQCAVMIWDTDGELSETFNRSVLVLGNSFTDSSHLVLSVPISPMPAGTRITYVIRAFDNDFDFNLREDRTEFVSDTLFTDILARPFVSFLYPGEGVITSCDMEDIIFGYQTAEGTLQTADIILDGLSYNLLSPNVRYGNDSIFVSPLSPLANGIHSVTIRNATDERGYPAIERSYSFIVDREAPRIVFTEPSEGSMLSTDEPVVGFSISDSLSGVDIASIIAIVIRSSEGDTAGSFNLSHLGSTSDGGFTLNFRQLNIHFSGSDSFTVIVSASDSPDLCSPNTATESIEFWLEPALLCSLSTNPFTPNNDGFNDSVYFSFPELYSKGGEISIFDSRGYKVKTVKVPPAGLKDAVWDGMDNGRKMPGGVYMYFISVDGKKICKGAVTLIR